MRKIIKYMFFMMSILLALTSIGCRSITVDLPDKHITYTNFGFDTKIGTLSVQMPDGASLKLENLDSNSQALSIANKALDLANTRVP